MRCKLFCALFISMFSAGLMASAAIPNVTCKDSESPKYQVMVSSQDIEKPNFLFVNSSYSVISTIYQGHVVVLEQNDTSINLALHPTTIVDSEDGLVPMIINHTFYLHIDTQTQTAVLHMDKRRVSLVCTLLE
jgi:hypothetical protein